jgi:antirestriction protein
MNNQYFKMNYLIKQFRNRYNKRFLENSLVKKIIQLGGLIIILIFSPCIGMETAVSQTTTQHLPSSVILSVMTGGNTNGNDVIREKYPRADGYRHINTPAMIARLKALHVNTYTYEIWHSPADWEDLKNEFASAAEAAGINIQVYVVSPSECFAPRRPHLNGRCSEPYKTNYIAWARAIAKLSLEYPNIKSWAIDDFLNGSNRKLFTREYLEKIRATADSINSHLKMFSTLYKRQYTESNLNLIQGVLDGVIFPYLGAGHSNSDPKLLDSQLNTLISKTREHNLKLALLIYAGRISSANLPPRATYISSLLHQAIPYLKDRRLIGIVGYGMPMQLGQQPSYLDRARSGRGRLVFTIERARQASHKSYASASQMIKIDPNVEKKVLSFFHFNQYQQGKHVNGSQDIQLLVDGKVVWEQPITSDPGHTWVHEKLNLTSELAGKVRAELTFRLVNQKGGKMWPIVYGIDDVTGSGIMIYNGGFEMNNGWSLKRNDPYIQPLIHIYNTNQPMRIFNAIGKVYASLQGEEFHFVSSTTFPKLHLGIQNRAMYGNGRLRFHIPKNKTIPAGSCASAWQEVSVKPHLARYQLSFWHMDWSQSPKMTNFSREVLIDGKPIWNFDKVFRYRFYSYGRHRRGPMDVSHFVRGKKKVRLTFRVCTDKQVRNVEDDINFDHIKTIGLRVHNPGFETSDGWHLHTAGPIKPKVVIVNKGRK